MEYRQGAVRSFPEGDARTVRFVISDESRDRHNSIIPAEAWDLKSFHGNPIAGWSHKVYGGAFDSNPDNIIGTWTIWNEGRELVGDLKFEDAETNPFAEKLLRKTKNGTLNAVSVGFMPGGGHYGEEAEARGAENETFYYDSAELVEVSLVGIPSNKNARKKALENGDIPELINDMIREALGDKFNDEEIEKLTIKGLFNILRGGDAAQVETADTGEAVDKQAREDHLKRVEFDKTVLDILIKYSE